MAEINLRLAPIKYDGRELTVMFGDQDTPLSATITGTDGTPADLTGATAWLVAQLPDGAHYYKGEATVSGSTLSTTPDKKKLCQMSGTALAYFVYTKDGSTYTTDRFAIQIITPYEDTSTLKSYDELLQSYIDKAKAKEDELDALKDTLSKEFDDKLASIDSLTENVTSLSETVGKIKQALSKLHISL